MTQKMSYHFYIVLQSVVSIVYHYILLQSVHEAFYFFIYVQTLHIFQPLSFLTSMCFWLVYVNITIKWSSGSYAEFPWHCCHPFSGRGNFLTLRDNNLWTPTLFIRMDSILTLQHPVRIKTGFSNQSQFWIQIEFLQSHITVVHILWGGAFTFFFLISTSHYIFFNKGHLGLHILDFYTPNYVIQALALAIHYRY